MSLLSLIMGASLISCGKETAESVEEPEEQVTESVEQEAEAPEEGSKVEFQESEPIIEVLVNDSVKSEEYKAAFNSGKIVGASYIKSGDSSASKFDSWQEAYKTIIDELGDSEVKYSLIYIDDDDIPELAYDNNDAGRRIATYYDGYVNLLMAEKVSELDYIEKGNSLLYMVRKESTYYDYVYAIKDGNWIELVAGERSPLDPWAEDSFDEAGEPIISSWKLDGEEISSQKDYDELRDKYFDFILSKVVYELEEPDAIINEIDAL
ncbi:hypothetical protein [Pseudobutyrivibrio xylanivorans]|uniref:Uncharacterized protein n=1 Tax=Pseudobutyrivibrio xylanivorans TaxID=185007 RepID=A0A5P6VSM6_PSEXY|nr:hypothetical protein [Pseudobutyrivibrio xylanivorans]QFJ55402.1 hypothetical protein FXF36_11275 [Pseudobutyrivibrio xylanivorans]